MEKEYKINKKMKIQEVVLKYPQTAPVFFKYGLHCVGCPGAQFETLEDIAKVHDIDIDKLINELNNLVKNDKE